MLDGSVPLSSRILVVDDEKGVRDSLTRWLALEGFTCRTCESSELAMQMVDAMDPGVVVVDRFLPGMDGLEFVRSIRARKTGYRSPYLVMVTGDRSTEILRDAFEAGVDDFIRKPLDAVEVVARLRAAKRILELQSSLWEVARSEMLAGLHRGSVRELSEVVATLAHDLRTPLGTIRMSAYGLRSKIGPDAPELAAGIDRIERVAGRMAEVVDDVVTAFVADNGTTEVWETFDPCAEIARAVEMAGGRAGSGVVISCPDGAAVLRGNPFGFRRIVLNLVANAVRHSQATRIEVGLSASPDIGALRLEVRDDGRGIHPDLLPRMGEPLLLSSSTHRQEFFVKGNGLGLTICRRILAQHGGKMVVGSGAAGTSVRCWFPVGLEHPQSNVDLAPLETEALA